MEWMICFLLKPSHIMKIKLYLSYQDLKYTRNVLNPKDPPSSWNIWLSSKNCKKSLFRVSYNRKFKSPEKNRNMNESKNCISLWLLLLNTPAFSRSNIIRSQIRLVLSVLKEIHLKTNFTDSCFLSWW